jgi:hypothetical protein
LISKYLAYEVDDEDDSTNISQKIIKRINFYSGEFPFKLNRLEKIIASRKIFSFGYDIYYRITIYIRPFFADKILTVNNSKAHKTINGIMDDNQFEKIDYIIYIFFIIEHLIPLLKEKYNFSEQINITLDFDDKDADTELIRFIMYYLNSYYPLIVGKMNIVRFEINNLKKNFAFRDELDTLNLFRVINILNNIRILIFIIKHSNFNWLKIISQIVFQWNMGVIII